MNSSMTDTKVRPRSDDLALNQVVGSTLPLVSRNGSKNTVNDEYDPFANRVVEYPTTDLETFMHLLKGCFGTGILAMPLAFKNAGIVFGLIATITIGIICTYCVHVLVKCAHKLARKRQVPSLGLAEVAESAFLVGPDPLRKYAKCFKRIVNTFLIVDMLGCCCVYVVFVSKNIKQILEGEHSLIPLPDNEKNALRLCMLLILPLLAAISMIRNLKYLAPLSMFANILIGISTTITLWYVFTDLPSYDTVPFVADWRKWPLFFGTAVFALEGVGVVMPLENNMKNPQHFIGCPSVLNLGMTVVVASYFTVGLFGYIKYGDKTEASITLNLPKDELLAKATRIMIALAIFLTYALQFYVPFEIIWNNIKHKFSSQTPVIEYLFRIALVVLTVVIAIVVPNLGPIITLVGALCLSFLGLVLPSFVEIITYWNDPGLGVGNWRLWKNAFIMAFGLLGLITGVQCSILEIIEEYGK